jgi:hypothetical protein
MISLKSEEAVLLAAEKAEIWAQWQLLTYSMK